MLYELIATVRPRSIAEVKDIARTAGKIILSNGGVIRGFTNWGVSALPKPIPNRSATATREIATKFAPDLAPQSNKHTIGHYFIMRFDSSARAQHLLRKTWNADPRLLRFSVVKMGTKLEDIADVGGRAEEWSGVPGNEGQVAPPEVPRKVEQADAVVGNLMGDVLSGTGARSANHDIYTYT